ncbi:hypothetical protein CROQUDRAFT_47765 [Cronartium quercuum f. sp. fusiforme G11]|uniref:Zn(2)-C6 fungal-type domain-containing protein n=1 Tax=Cronartium quercuum f. sp. fusiforme G11 TaxID=708437 RepID=A0A9P6T9H5_9BASI|nr:hypothetical protein CROQUDRAFT_47765 [Cronartium quercuum f. sp. fusiforme G11]
MSNYHHHSHHPNPSTTYPLSSYNYQSTSTSPTISQPSLARTINQVHYPPPPPPVVNHNPSSNPLSSWPSLSQPTSASNHPPPPFNPHSHNNQDDSSDGGAGFSEDGDSIGPLLSSVPQNVNLASSTFLSPAQAIAKKKKDPKEVKRRSSKACDNCRKSKCKCTRTPDPNGVIPTTGPCQNCLTTGTECTFNGASRKRGPPKGYIEAIESRLHRMEALLGGLLQNDDPRAQALLSELIGDNEVRDLLKKDLKAAAEQGSDGKIRKSWKLPELPPITSTSEVNKPTKLDLNLTETQKALWGVRHLDQPGVQNPSPDPEPHRTGHNSDPDETSPGPEHDPGQPRHQRRRLNSETEHGPNQDGKASRSSTLGHGQGSSSINELTDVVGQLSLNEDDEVRYHGRSSGLYLITASQRHQDYFWRFPQPGVWPEAASRRPRTELEIMRAVEPLEVLPSPETMVHLLEVYWTYVHPLVPVLYKPEFTAQFGKLLTTLDSRQSGGDRNLDWLAALTPTPAGDGNEAPIRPVISIFLLLVMFSLAARYSHISSGPPVDGEYWDAGDVYLAKAKKLLDYTYANGKLTTCQALVLFAYREIGIGAMAESWQYTGMAIRMAQDMGLFRDVDKWYMPVKQFTKEEKQTRKRVWWACVVLDKYVSTYIGRPMMIFERDYDTAFVSEDEPDEHELWKGLRPDGSCIVNEGSEEEQRSHALSCFNRSASLSVLISRIIANLYAIRLRVHGQSSDTLLALLDQNLAHWYLDLPSHLRYNPIAAPHARAPTPHLLTLHAQFYTALILLHRPFIPHPSREPGVGSGKGAPYPSHSICTTSANAITNIAKVYADAFGLKQAPAFMVYYVFTAAILHVYNSTFEAGTAVTAKRGLLRCMNSLKEMALTWPGAVRAYDLLVGLVDLRDVSLDEPSIETSKRPVESTYDSAPIQSHTPSVRPIAGSSRVSSASHHPQPQAVNYVEPIAPCSRPYTSFQQPQSGLNDILSSYFGRSPDGSFKPPEPVIGVQAQNNEQNLFQTDSYGSNFFGQSHQSPFPLLFFYGQSF